MHLYIAVVTELLWKTLRHVTDVAAVKTIFDENSISVPLSLLWLPKHRFKLDLWSGLQLASFIVRDRKYLSAGFIFRISEATTLIVLRGW